MLNAAPIFLKLQKVIFRAHYRAKFYVLRLIVGRNAATYVLYNSLFPDLVLRMFGAKIGRNVRVGRWLTLHEADNDFSGLVIGDDVHIGKHVLLDLTGKITIEARCGIGMFSRILTHQNPGISTLRLLYPPGSGDITVPADTVVSAGAFILFPTTLAKGTMVGSLSVVRGTFSRPCVLMGNPARVVKFLDETL